VLFVCFMSSDCDEPLGSFLETQKAPDTPQR
jgi:hypothetical protein